MKVIFNHILFGLLALLTLFTACHRVEPTPTPLGYIFMDPRDAGETRALLEDDDFATIGNQIRVYDYYQPTSPTDTDPNRYYIPGTLIEYNGSSWPFIGDVTRYEWTEDGVHKFFGWLEKDNNGTGITASDFFGTDLGLNTTSHVLTIPTTALSQDSPQFDFMYSEIEPREPATEGFDPVSLEFNHLFTAFKITAANNSSNKVYLKKVTITGLKNKRSVTISYAGNENPAVNYVYPTDTKASDFVYEVAAAGLELSKNAINVSSPSDDSYTMMWAHSKEDFAEAKVVVEYNYQEPNGPLNTDGKTTVELKDLKWDAGSKNVLGLMFKDKEITLTCKVEPWNMVEEEIDFTDQISVSKPIKWEENTVEHVDYNTGEVILYSDTQIVGICNFHIDTPAGATWTASLIPVEGYSDAFAIEDGTKYGAVGVDSQIKIRVTNKAPIAPRHVVKLRITVQTADGRTIIADLMPKNDQNEELKEFKLIQNLING